MTEDYIVFVQVYEIRYANN